MGSLISRRISELVRSIAESTRDTRYLFFVYDDTANEMAEIRMIHTESLVRHGWSREYYRPEKGGGAGVRYEHLSAIFNADGSEREGVGFHDEDDKGPRAFRFGILKKEQRWKDGKKHGYYAELWPDGTAKIMGRYWEGFRDGKFTEYTKDGICTKVAEYRAGRCVYKRRWCAHGSAMAADARDCHHRAVNRGGK